MTYSKIFDPIEQLSCSGHSEPTVADRSGSDRYVYSDDVVLAINIALATGRPLLVRGRSGIGKSSLARSVATQLNASFYDMVITGRTEARDFLWRVDHVRRLRDAQIGGAVDDVRNYVLPGPLFWAFEPETARELLDATGRGQFTPPGHIAAATETVVLIDEIDKADPDVPNALLEPLGSLTFQVEDLALRIAATKPPLILVTTNEERDLSRAFIRRCVELQVVPPDLGGLVRIGRAHFPDSDGLLLSEIADHLLERAAAADMAVSTAEFLDTVRACIALKIAPDHPVFEQVARATGVKGEHV